MPQLGETVTEGTVTKWFKSVGEIVERDEPLFEISTDKVDSEVPSPAAGVLSEILVPEGETVEVGTVLAVVASEVAASAQSPLPEAPAAQAGVPMPAAVEREPALSPVAPATSLAVRVPEDGARTPDGVGRTAGRIFSPVVRRLLGEYGLDPSEVPGTGPGGRVTRSDVLKVIDARREAGVPVSGLATPPRVDTAARAAVPARADTPTRVTPAVQVTTPARSGGEAQPAARVGNDEIVPFTNIRRRTAEHMARSKATSAHALVVLEADYEQVERVRRAHGSQFKAEEGFSLTYLPFVARAVVEALGEWPNLNSSVGDDALIVHHERNLGIAVDLDHHGLIVPVVQRAEELTLRGMARKIRDLADRARSKKLSADDISGGTFSITNAGPFGTLLTAPVINQPQVAILSTDAVRRRPVVVAQEDGGEAVAIHSVGLLCLSWDHRAVDGAYAAAFVARVVQFLATHHWSAEL
jgi:2-oxoglutarate dehydrogenase E2 component (dihydrolipoamide succinyltransferase)